MKAPFLFCGIYAVGLSALILSRLETFSVLNLFLASPYSLGTHTLDWMNWHAAGCFFVGLVNLCASRWSDARPRRDVAAASAFVFGIWAVLNLRLMFSGLFLYPMWLNVIGCVLASVWSMASAARIRAVEAANAESSTRPVWKTIP